MNLTGNYTYMMSNDNRVLKTTIYSLLIASSLLCNSFIIILFTRNIQLRRSINYYILNMAISDLLVPMCSISYHLVRSVSRSYEWKVNGQLGLYLCKIVLSFSDLSPLVSTFCLVSMSLDRFLAIVYPTKRHLRTPKVRRRLIVLSWTIPMIYCLKGLYSYTLIKNIGCGEYWGPPLARHIAAFTIIKTFHSTVFILFPLVLIVVFYSCMLWTLRKQHIRHTKTILCNYQQQLRQKQRRRINILAFSIVLGFGLCYTPLYFIVYITFSFTKWTLPSGFLKKVIFPAHVLAYANATINPMICILFNSEIRKTLKAMFPCNAPRDNNSTTSYDCKVFGLRGTYDLKTLDVGQASATVTTGSVTYLTGPEERVNISCHHNERFVTVNENEIQNELSDDKRRG